MLYLLESSQKSGTSLGFSDRVDVIWRTGYKRAEEPKKTQGDNLKRNKADPATVPKGGGTTGNANRFQG